MFRCPALSRIATAFGAALLAAAASAAPARAQTACATADNLVQNCGFEAGTSAWTFAGGFLGTSTSSVYVHSGTTGVAGGTVGGLGHVSQSLATTAGQAYTVSFWYNSAGTATSALFASFGGQTLLDQMNLPAVGWTQFSFDVVAQGATSVLDIGLRNDPSYDGLDDVRVTAAASTVTPEPATWTLMGAGLVALVAAVRRRRAVA